MRLQYKNISHRYISEIAFFSRSCTYVSNASESAMCETYVLLAKVRRVVYTLRRSRLARTKQITESVIHCLAEAMIVFLNSKLLAHNKQ